jgi:hypothetical protein
VFDEPLFRLFIVTGNPPVPGITAMFTPPFRKGPAKPGPLIINPKPSLKDEVEYS